MEKILTTTTKALRTMTHRELLDLLGAGPTEVLDDLGSTLSGEVWVRTIVHGKSREGAS